MARLKASPDESARAGLDELQAMLVVADATIHFAHRHAQRADELAESETDAGRRAELQRIAAICRRVPEHPPRDFHEALQAYWFCHLGVITELNGWGAAGEPVREVQQPARATQGRRDGG
jgi:formate C-acetyltransferase